MSAQAQGAGLDAGLAVATAASAVQVAIRTAALTGDEVPAWAGTVAELLHDWSQQLGPGERAAGQAGAVRASGAWWRASRGGVLEGDVASAAPLSTQPLTTWLRLRFGVRRCLACGRLGNRSLQPTHPLVSPARAQTWSCVDRLACRQRRLRREPDRAEVLG